MAAPDEFMFAAGIMAAGDPAETLARISAQGRIYLKFTATHPIDGSRLFYWGDSAFIVEGAEVVYPVVTSWGAMRQFLAQDGQDRESETDVEVAGLAYCVASGYTKRYQLKDLVAALVMDGVLVEFFQWDADSAASTLIWSGCARELGRMQGRSGALTFHLICGARPTTVDDPISQVIDAAAYPGAPQDSLGRMVSRAYGDFITDFDRIGGSDIRPVAFGYGGRFIPGIDVDDSVGSIAAATIIYSKNDGSTASLLADAPTADNPDGDFWIYVPEAGTYASIYKDTGTQYVFPTNDATSVRANVLRTPKAMVYFRPIENGSTTTLGTTLYKAVDDDPTNYVETTAANFVLSWKCPILTFLGGRILNVRVVLDHWHDTASVGHRDPKFGLWDVVAGTWLNTKFDQVATSIRRAQVITAIGKVYTAADLSTRAEFSEGRFITRDGSGNEKPLELRVEPDTNLGASGKDKYRLYSVALVCTVELPAKSIDIKIFNRGIPNPFFDPKSRFPLRRYLPPQAREVVTPADSVAGTQFLLAGKAQKDDASGTVTGTASGLIQKYPDVARHILQVVKGYSVNAGAGTLGNFVDARAETVAKEKHVACRFGIDPKSVNDALLELQRRLPLRLAETDGKWHAFLDEMNPDASRVYRSGSNPIRVSAKKHIDIESFECPTTDPRGIVNNMQLNYAHAYGTEKPMGTTTYAHPLSRETYMYGAKQLVTVDEPWIPRNDLLNENPHPAATAHAKWLGTRNARARCLPHFKVSQALFDMKRGHVWEFDSDMESAGLYCPAKRCGLLDYAYTGTTEGTNYANDSAPYLIFTSAAISYFLVSQQVDGFDFTIGTAGVYTSVSNAWKYWNGSAFVALSGVTNADAFKSTGSQSVRWTRPLITSVKKAEFIFNGVSKGPSYCYTYEHGAVTTRARGSAATTYPAKWIGRVFETIEATRRPGSLGQYPYMDIVAQEVM